MTAAAVDPRGWSRRRWWGVIAAAFGVQLALILWFGDRQRVIPRTVRGAPGLTLAAGHERELAESSNPTLFPLASQHGFSGEAWLGFPPPAFVSYDWTEPPRWLALPTGTPANALHRLLETNAPTPFELADKREPTVQATDFRPALSLMPTQSLLRTEGDLAGRALVASVALPAWPAGDILTNSVVQVVVDAGGRTVSAALLARCGLKEADHYALELAKTLRFVARRDGSAGETVQPARALDWGALVFTWHTTALPASNAPPAGP